MSNRKKERTKEKEQDNDIDAIIENTFNHLKDIVDANTVVGTTIKLTDNLFVIPVSKISVGLISGGCNVPNAKKNNNYNAGSGTGFNIVPIGFITINNSIFNYLPVNNDDMNNNIINGLMKIMEQFMQKVNKGDFDKDEKKE